jgi:hypothetical protein
VAVPPEAEAAEEPAPTLPGFSGDQLQRLRTLRAWLERRKEERQSGGAIDPDRKPPRELTVYSDRQLLTPLGQRYALGFQKNRRNGELPTLRIGRGADGRIHHRYVFSPPEQAEAEPETPTPLEPTDSRRLSASAGALASRQRIVRVWTPEPQDPETAPRLEYELPDPRR